MKGIRLGRGMVGLLTLSLCLAGAMPGNGAVPQTISTQGYLRNGAGLPANGSLSIEFALYSVATGGVPLWSETQSVTVNNGVYSVALGAVTPLALPFDVPYYLGVKVAGDAEMTPRQPLASVGYAFRAAMADAASATDSLVGQYWGSTTGKGCVVLPEGFSCPPASCFDASGANMCTVAKNQVYPATGWSRLAAVTVDSPGILQVRLDKNAVYCLSTHEAFSLTLELRLQRLTFTGAPPANWPNDSQNYLFTQTGSATETGPVSAGHYLAQAPLAANLFTSPTIPAGRYLVFLKATPDTSFSAADSCYLMATPVVVTFIPAGNQITVAP